MLYNYALSPYSATGSISGASSEVHCLALRYLGALPASVPFRLYGALAFKHWGMRTAFYVDLVSDSRVAVSLGLDRGLTRTRESRSPSSDLLLGGELRL